MENNLLPVLSFGTGSAKEPIEKAGLAHLVEHLVAMELLDKGIIFRKTPELTYLYTAYFIDFDENQKVEDIVEIIRNMEIDPDTVDIEKDIIHQECVLTNINRNPEFLLSQFLLTGGRVDSRLKTPSGLLNITVDDIHSFIKEHYTVDNSYILFEEHEDEEQTHNNNHWLDILLSDFDQECIVDDMLRKGNEHIELAPSYDNNNYMKFTIFDIVHAADVLKEGDHYSDVEEVFCQLLPRIRHELLEDYYFDISYTVHNQYFIYYIVSSDDFSLDDLVSLLESKDIKNVNNIFKRNNIIKMGHDYNFVNETNLPKTRLRQLRKELQIYADELIQEYPGLSVKILYNKTFGCYELLFSGDEYEYNEEMWDKIDSYMVEHFTDGDRYVSYEFIN